jgi:hypothetical protein
VIWIPRRNSPDLLPARVGRRPTQQIRTAYFSRGPKGRQTMPTITTKDGTEIFYKDWGPRDAQPIMFHHGWPLSSDDWDAQSWCESRAAACRTDLYR